MKGILITVNYNSFNITVRFINSIRKLDFFNHLTVLIVDNSITDEDAILLDKYVKDNSLKNILISRNKENKGYFGSVNYAVKELNLNFVDYDFSIISNNDIIIEDVGFLGKLMQNMGKTEIIAPSIISLLTCKDQNPYRENEITKLQKIMYKVYYTNYVIGYGCLLLWLFYKFVKGNPFIGKPDEHKIYSGHGAFVILSVEFFRKGGYIDDRLFLYGEEEFITAVAKQNGMEIKYIPLLRVYHDEHKTTNSDRLTRRIYKYQKEAYNFIKNEFNGIY